MCRSSEITENQAKNIVVNQDDREVHDVKDDSKKLPGKPRGAKGKRKQTKKSFNCRRCGQVHQPQECAAFGQVCHKCKQRNHYSKICQSKPRDSSKHVSEFRRYDSDTDEFFIGVLGTKPLIQKDWIQSVVKLDTGDQCNLLPYALYCKLTREKMRKSKTRLVSYTGHKIPAMGKATLQVKPIAKSHPVEFQIIEHPATPVVFKAIKNYISSRESVQLIPKGMKTCPVVLDVIKMLMKSLRNMKMCLIVSDVWGYLSD